MNAKALKEHVPFYAKAAEGTFEKVTPKNGKYFECEELQNYVGGNIELVFLQNEFEDYVLVIDENGKLKDNYINLWATALARVTKSIMKDDFIVGDVVIAHRSMFR